MKKLKKNLIIISLLLILLVLYTGCELYNASSPEGSSSISSDNITSTKLLGAPGSITNASGITTDLDGNVYITGYTEGNLDGQILTGYRDLFIVKYDTNGDKQWTRLLSVSESTTMAFGITLDLSGNIYVTGHTNGNLDGETLTGIYDLFVVKYDSSGSKQWTRLLGVSGEGTYAYGIASDTEGNIYTTGYTEGDLDGETLTGNRDLFVVKYDSSGSKQWTRLLGVSGTVTEARSITSDTDGNIYTTGYTSGNLDGEILTGDRDLFVVKYDTDGNKLWTRLIGVSGKSTRAYGITSDTDGNIYLTGYTNGNLDGQTKTGNEDLFVIKYDMNGVKQWTRLLGVSGERTRAYSITLDSERNIYITGETFGNLDGQTKVGNADLFVVKYNTNGVKQWTRLLGVSGSANTLARGIASDLSSNIYTTGYTNGNLDGQIITGSFDLFIVKYNSDGVKQ